jgi:Na+/melibiose symporter-like transporter
MKTLLGIRVYIANLWIMSLSWSAASFTYYMVAYYLKYIPGNIYVNIILSSLAEAIIILSSGFIAKALGSKTTLFLSFAVGGFFGMGLIFVNPENTIAILICILLTKSGIASAFNLCFLVTAEFFPIMFSSTVFGACNIIARITSIMAPIIAEM